ADAAKGPFLVLGSMWPDYWRLLTEAPDDTDGPDRHRAARALLGQAQEITAPARFTAGQLAELNPAIAADPRLRAAVRQAAGGQITQDLAGAPVLFRRYRHAEPVEQAVLHAAMDARRLGHGLYLPEPFLAHAVAGYLDADTWDRYGGGDWLSTA